MKRNDPERTLVMAEVPKSLRKKYKKACQALGYSMRGPLVLQMNKTIKEAKIFLDKY